MRSKTKKNDSTDHSLNQSCVSIGADFEEEFHEDEGIKSISKILFIFLINLILLFSCGRYLLATGTKN